LLMIRREFVVGLGRARRSRGSGWCRESGSSAPKSADDDFKNLTVPFVQSLKETGFVEDQNVTVEYR
jgi:hypothetical protein